MKQKNSSTCKNCNNQVLMTNRIIYRNKSFCSENCKIRFAVNRSKTKYTEEDFYAECKICNLRAPTLGPHIRNHNISIEEYKNKFNCEIISKNYSKIFSEKIKGDKNPGYQHGGKLSVFSNNFIHFTEYSKEKAINASKITKTLNPHKENTKIEYYLNEGFSKKEALKQLTKRQTTFSKKICIEKYGEDEGLQIWKERQKNWQNNINSKSEAELKLINKKKMFKGGISKIENSIREELEKHYKIETQLVLRTKENKYFIYDICFKDKIIEVNGDYWHANPDLYKSDTIMKENLKAENIWIKDKIKKENAEKHGYKILSVWEKDIKDNKEKVIEECLNFLKS